MEQQPWIDNPKLKDMHPLKIQIMTELAENTSGKSLIQSAPYLLKAQQSLNSAGLSFSEEESALLIGLLTKDMSLEEKQQIERMKTIINQHM